VALDTVDSKTVQGKYLGLYFSAHWCPPCRAFTPVLAEWYNSEKKPDNMDIVFVSADRSKAEFNDYFATMPFKALPFDSEFKSSVPENFNISGYPTLIILAPDGSIVTKEGRKAIMDNPDGFPWAN
jgi:nucleoredoxin